MEGNRGRGTIHRKRPKNTKSNIFLCQQRGKGSQREAWGRECKNGTFLFVMCPKKLHGSVLTHFHSLVYKKGFLRVQMRESTFFGLSGSRAAPAN